MNLWVMFQACFKVFPSIIIRMTELLYVPRMLLGGVVVYCGGRNEGTNHNMAMKVTARKLLLALYLVTGVGAICGLLYPYGGWRGNVDSLYFPSDVAIPGYLLFNRWWLPHDYLNHGEPLGTSPQ